jgi:hypothetical protein
MLEQFNFVCSESPKYLEAIVVMNESRSSSPGTSQRQVKPAINTALEAQQLAKRLVQHKQAVTPCAHCISRTFAQGCVEAAERSTMVRTRFYAVLSFCVCSVNKDALHFERCQTDAASWQIKQWEP